MAVLSKLEQKSSIFQKYKLWIILSTIALAVIFSVTIALDKGFINTTNFNQVVNEDVMEHWNDELQSKHTEISALKTMASEEIEAMSKKMALMQAKLIQIEGAAERVIEAANLDKAEFGFDQPLAIGGISEGQIEFERPRFEDALSDLDLEIERKQERLAVLAETLYSKDWQNKVKLSGRPVKQGFMSSRYGFRANPFNGGLDFHAGVDFAAVIGTPIYTTGAGIVSYSGSRGGYGNVIEVTHMDGKVTRYAHCNKLLAKVGQVVEQGDIIAEVGNTGNSTGPHLHYEVIENGKQINPAPYLIELSKKSS